MKINFILISFFLIGCADSDTTFHLDEKISKLELESLPSVTFPLNNISSADKVELGRMLFWDPILGGEFDVACATCHHPNFAYGDGIDLPIGVRGLGLGIHRVEGEGIDRVPRNSPTILNTAYNGLTKNHINYNPDSAVMFWDSREQSLEEQSKKPPTSRSEMLGDFIGGQYALEYILPRLKEIEAYVKLFSLAFPEDDNPINITNYSKAMATFERTLIASNSPYDQYIDGNLSALSETQKRGLLLFNGKAKCSVCHSGPMLSDWSLHALGTKEHPIKELQGGPDKGDQRFDDFKFRTPSLRNISLTAPYMHNGMYATLEEVIEFQIKGSSENLYVEKVSDLFEPVSLTKEEINELIEFMRALEDNNFDKTIPLTVPSGLNPGGNID
ncbi:MAG: cytochrome-c peroxidase [Cyclobacteriaceae bacterium]|nr:cytochrome-c peroxidase [Cyclobacteriaceae bacterium]